VAGLTSGDETAKEILTWGCIGTVTLLFGGRLTSGITGWPAAGTKWIVRLFPSWFMKRMFTAFAFAASAKKATAAAIVAVVNFMFADLAYCNQNEKFLLKIMGELTWSLFWMFVSEIFRLKEVRKQAGRRPFLYTSSH